MRLFRVAFSFLLVLAPLCWVSAASQDPPDAILGKGQAPKGSLLEYHPGARGYLSLPAESASSGSVLLIHEWNGLVDRIRQVADSFAAEGYIALAADLYDGRTGSNPRENMALVRETLAQPEKIVANLNAAVSYLKSRDDSNQRVAVIGWCYGGGVALTFAINGELHEGTAIFYGRLLDDPEQLKKITHPVYGTFALLDRGPSPSQVESFVNALRSAGVDNDVHIYDEVNHGFWLYVDRNPDTSLVPATDAWLRLKRYLRDNIAE